MLPSLYVTNRAAYAFHYKVIEHQFPHERKFYCTMMFSPILTPKNVALQHDWWCVDESEFPQILQVAMPLHFVDALPVPYHTPIDPATVIL